jgi:hypothetical protein
MAVEASRRPKPVHAVQDSSGAISSKFWAQPGDQENSDEEEPEPSTPEFIKEAAQAGFSLDQLIRAEQSLNSGKTSTSEDLRLPKAILSTLVQRKFAGVPCQDPLPEPRVSPPRTLGDALAKATHQKSGSRRGSVSSVSSGSRSPAYHSQAKKEEFLIFFEKPGL